MEDLTSETPASLLVKLEEAFPWNWFITNERVIISMRAPCRLCNPEAIAEVVEHD